MRIADIRQEYMRAGLVEKDAAADPFKQFDRWFHDALEADLPLPNAMTLATATAAGRPSARVVLLKGVDAGGFVFYTNFGSRKARELEAGAGACLVERFGAEAYAFSSDKVAAYANLKAASGLIAAAYFDQPSQQLDVLAVTGTNGKTSTAWWLAQALSNLKLTAPIPCGLVGTLGIGTPPPAASGQPSVGLVAAHGADPLAGR